MPDAYEAGDIDAVVALLTGDAWLKMPPQPFESQGAAAIGNFLADRARQPRGAAAARPDARERPARVRLLLPVSPH